MPAEFRNEPFTDFSKEENAQAMRAALEKVKGELGREYPLVIGAVHHKQSLRDSNLHRRQPHTGGGVHRLKHIADELGEIRVKLGHRISRCIEHRRRPLNYLQ